MEKLTEKRYETYHSPPCGEFVDIEEYIDELNKLKEEKGITHIEFQINGDDEIEINCCIEREETDEEFEKRKLSEEKSAEWRRNNEYAQYLELKAKYDPEVK